VLGPRRHFQQVQRDDRDEWARGVFCQSR
jgi:hypothetical protein